jgi:hypothetical protein
LQDQLGSAKEGRLENAKALDKQINDKIIPRGKHHVGTRRKSEQLVEEITPSSILKKTLVLAFTIALERCASRAADAARAID